MLIIGWSILEGIGGAMMMPNIQTLLRDKYEGQERATDYSVIGAVGAIGAAVGPIVGGFLFIFPLLLQLSFEYTAIETGLALMPFSLAVLIAAMAGARLSARMSAKRMIQIGFLIAIAGLLAFVYTVQSDITAAQLSSGALFGIGLGLILPTTLNLNLSMIPAKDTPETAGLNSTFEQWGNSIGVALVGAMMLLALSAGLVQRIEANTILLAENQRQLVAVVDEGVELMSDTQLTNALEAAGGDAATTDEIVNMYEDSRVEAFRAAVAFMIFVAFVGLILTMGLSNRMLVGEKEPEMATTT